MSLGQTRADVQGQAPQGLRLSGSSPKGRAVTFKMELEFTLKLVLEGQVMLGGTQ